MTSRVRRLLEKARAVVAAYDDLSATGDYWLDAVDSEMRALRTELADLAEAMPVYPGQVRCGETLGRVRVLAIADRTPERDANVLIEAADARGLHCWIALEQLKASTTPVE